MNICFLSREYPPKIIGGVGTYTYEMAQALRALGHGVYIITEAIGEERELYEDGIYVMRIACRDIPLFAPFRNVLKMTIDRLEYSYAVSKKLSRIVEKYKIDIVESCEARAEGFWYYLFHRKPPLIIKLHTPEKIAFRLDRITESLDVKIRNLLEEWWILRADKIVAVTKAIAGLVSHYYHIELKDLSPVYYPLNAELFKPNGHLSKNTNPVVLYAGRLEVRKGVLILLEAIPLVIAEFPNVQFYFVGADAGIKYRMDKMIDRLGCAKNITFVSQVSREEMVSYYRSSDICVFPSLWENFAFTALEAMACAKTVIVSRTGGFLEMIDDGVTGIFCDPEDPCDVAEKMRCALRDASFRASIGEQARARVLQRYAPRKKAKEMAEIYQKMLSRNNHDKKGE
ncbi:MAG: hypothetical protein A2Y00_07025 [Omnitrophica WOR_2 bacterium GWF2_43_52]|nr:MAG: hypothetical protein A2Y06_05150 [Omnitrophica WOR_2 bacterium GWA2_37_7]OGX20174.1 MAG: hypothetical protein A2Y00_07025 [Omnitrophica WOR_2 bacterium GWF2_43_52]OGX55743.1 MAG: hypothetical protein A2460_09140 [Omnitrophica WOR_2 bacterium RIFOXYC2_FULL_43_9]HAH19299.1 hypothetical protein [Candidatus Omnitrophota bacterium]HBG63678.1 hypothetical protein [Candidatus Omnitrophota bacterium]